MRFEIPRTPFSEAVVWAARGLPTRPPNPISAGLRLAIAGDQLSVGGFDYEVSTEATMPVASAQDGHAVVSGRLLADITRKLPAESVGIVADDHRLHVTCGKALFTLPVLADQNTYPTLPAMPPAVGSVGVEPFAEAVGQVAMAAAGDEMGRPELTGVLLETVGPTMTLVATNTYRMAVRQLSWQPAGDDPLWALVPVRTMVEAARTLPGGVLTLGLDAGVLGFGSPGRRTTVRLLSREFPRYSRVLAAPAVVASVEAAALAAIVDRIALVAPPKTPIRLTFDTRELTVAAGGGDGAVGTETLDASSEADGVTLMFNPTYLLDGLRAIGSAIAQFSFTSPRKQVLLTGDETAASYRYLMMPIVL